MERKEIKSASGEQIGDVIYDCSPKRKSLPIKNEPQREGLVKIQNRIKSIA